MLPNQTLTLLSKPVLTPIIYYHLFNENLGQDVLSMTEVAVPQFISDTMPATPCADIKLTRVCNLVIDRYF